MRTLEKRIKRLEDGLGIKEPSLVLVLRKIARREQWRPPPDNLPSAIRGEWVDPEDVSILGQG
jgi:hypothetical protein